MHNVNILPQNGLNGQYQITAENASLSIWVEEYKRPTFEVKIDMPKAEIRFGDKVTVLVELSGASQNFAKWEMRTQIMLGETLAAIVTVQGAWMDVLKRKITTPPQNIIDVFEKAPRSEDFKVI